MKVHLRSAVLAALFAGPLTGGALSATCAQAQAPSSSSSTPAESLFHATTLSLAASGETRLTPDQASINLGVASEAPTAAQALADNAARMNRVLAALKAGGIAAKDIRTSGLNLNPQQVYHEGQPPRITGYQASEHLTVTVRDLARLGGAVDATVAAGATQVNGISFSLADPTAAEDAAREQAVRALQAKAELYARATGYRVTRLVSLSEGAAEGLPRPPLPMAAMARIQSAPTAVEPGELTVRIEVDGLFELTR